MSATKKKRPASDQKAADDANRAKQIEAINAAQRYAPVEFFDVRNPPPGVELHPERFRPKKATGVLEGLYNWSPQSYWKNW